MSGSEVVNLQIKDIINEIRPVVINKKRTELDARHDIGRENKVTEIMELISTKNIDLMEYLESMLYRVIQRVSMLSKEKFSSDSSVVLKSPISLLRSRHRKMWTAWVLPVTTLRRNDRWTSWTAWDGNPAIWEDSWSPGSIKDWRSKKRLWRGTWLDWRRNVGLKNNFSEIHSGYAASIDIKQEFPTVI